VNMSKAKTKRKLETGTYHQHFCGKGIRVGGGGVFGRREEWEGGKKEEGTGEGCFKLGACGLLAIHANIYGGGEKGGKNFFWAFESVQKNNQGQGAELVETIWVPGGICGTRASFWGWGVEKRDLFRP